MLISGFGYNALSFLAVYAYGEGVSTLTILTVSLS